MYTDRLQKKGLNLSLKKTQSANDSYHDLFLKQSYQSTSDKSVPFEKAFFLTS